LQNSLPSLKVHLVEDNTQEQVLDVNQKQLNSPSSAEPIKPKELPTTWKEIIKPDLAKYTAGELIANITEYNLDEKVQRLMLYSLKNPSTELNSKHSPILLPLLSDVSDVRFWSVVCLSKIGSQDAVQPIIKQLAIEADPLVKEAMCIALGRFCLPAAIPVLTQLWRNDSSENVKNSAKCALQKIGGPEVQNLFKRTEVIQQQIQAELTLLLQMKTKV